MNFRLMGKKSMILALSLALTAGAALSAVLLPKAEASTGKCSGVNDSQGGIRTSEECGNGFPVRYRKYAKFAFRRYQQSIDGSHI